MVYGVKVMLTYSVGQNDQRFYEEMILRVIADSFEKAYVKAEDYAKRYNDTYVNPDGEAVNIINIESIDCFLAYDEENDVEEVFSCFSKNRCSLNDDEYYTLITTQCDADELYPLRNIDFN